MAERTELEAMLHQFNVNWRACGHAEDRGNTAMLNELNARHRMLIEWFRERGVTFNDLDYNPETSTFALPTGILVQASR